ncbi:MAG: hypothetical protein ABFD54_05715 [Armatimonadota bacterium]|nr:hypothetical protein [bacterium]
MRLPRSSLRDSMSIEPFAGNTAYGPRYGAITTEPCIFEPGYKKITDKLGAEVVASAFCILGATSTTKTQDRVTKDGQVYEVIDAQPIPVNGRVSHVEVYLKSIGG